jgi:hypothetical protein
LLSWAAVAPTRPSPSSDFSDPANPAYNWSSIDQQVKLAVKNGLEPILDVLFPPAWAQKPDPPGTEPAQRYVAIELRSPGDVGKFMRAAARRYSGSFQGLPRVHYWQVWNEPNLSDYLMPQYRQGEPASPGIYRQMVNSVAAAVHGVHKDNVVIAGVTSPYRLGQKEDNPRINAVGMAPLDFMREVLCVSADAKPKPTCGNTIAFDVWSHHPYTKGGPHQKAEVPGNVELGNLPEMKAALDAAVRARHIKSDGPVGLWITEFSWDSNPPDPDAVPVKLEAQWVAEALYWAWQNGVSLFTWFRIRDQKYTGDPKGITFQSSLYQRGATIAQDQPKPALAAFRFPFVGHIVNDRVTVWGRTPWGKPGRVLVEESVDGGWTKLGILTTNQYGILTKTFDFSADAGAYVRARVLGKGGLSAPPFPLAGPKDLPNITSFGS